MNLSLPKKLKNRRIIMTLGFIFLSFSLLSLTVIYIGDQYTKEEIDKIVKQIAESYYPFERCNWEYGEEYEKYIENRDAKVGTIYLFDVLTANNNVIMERYSSGSGGISQFKLYETEWRDKICRNPVFISMAWDIYGELALRKLNSRLSYFKGASSDNKSDVFRDGRETAYNSSKFSTREFWRAQMNLLSRYNKLASELDLLSNNDLDYYINSCDVDDAAASYDFKQWLLNKDLMTPKNNNCVEELPNYQCKYPGDLLLLIKRVCLNQPETLNYRKCLTLTKEMTTKIQTTIKKLGYVN